MAIEIIKLKDGFGVKFPFDLKDNFKSVFKSATWNPERRCWKVGVRSKKRLDQWVAAAQAAAEDIEAAEAAELNQQELDRLLTDLAKMRSRIADVRKRRGDMNAADLLAAAKNDLKKAQADFVAEKKALAQALEENKCTVEKYVDIDGIYAAISKMEANHGKIGSNYHTRFNEAQRIIDTERERLAKAGWRSKGLDGFSMLNFNRPDRDKVSDITLSSIYELKKIDPETGY